VAEPLPPGGVIGILGGGQLGRMLSVAAARLGLKCIIFDPDPGAPAAQVAWRHVCAGYDDMDALDRFGAEVDVITYEFENIPTAALDRLGDAAPIRPGRRALAVSQDRLDEKRFLEGLGLSVAPYAAVDNRDDLLAAVETVGMPSILKTRRFGYDGKGQARLSGPGEVDRAWEAVQAAPCVLEGFVDFEREVSVIGARALDGSVACFDPGENVHREGILRTTTLPAHISPALATDAVLLTGKVLNALDYVGVIGVELFVTDRGLLVNEFAPRVHNSGHWTQDACLIDQFEQHIRAVAGWRLGDGARHADAVMTNLIGDDVAVWAETDGAALHLYGKAEARAGRKMGHVNRIRARS